MSDWIEERERRHLAATPGEWQAVRFWKDGTTPYHAVKFSNHTAIHVWTSPTADKQENHRQDRENANFIAVIRNEEPRVLAILKAVRALVERTTGVGFAYDLPPAGLVIPVYGYLDACVYVCAGCGAQGDEPSSVLHREECFAEAIVKALRGEHG